MAVTRPNGRAFSTQQVHHFQTHQEVLEEGELDENMVVAKFATTTKHGAIEGKTQEHLVSYYNLDMIISVGYRVHSYRGVQFRIWATKVLKEYIVKGFAMNDDLLKRAGGGNYFDELLSRIRDIRSSEKDSIARYWKSMRSVSTMTLVWNDPEVLQDGTKQDALFCAWAYRSRNHL